MRTTRIRLLLEKDIAEVKAHVAKEVKFHRKSRVYSCKNESQWVRQSIESGDWNAGYDVFCERNSIAENNDCQPRM